MTAYRTSQAALLEAIEERKGIPADLVTSFACWYGGPRRVPIVAVEVGDKTHEFTFRELLAGDL